MIRMTVTILMLCVTFLSTAVRVRAAVGGATEVAPQVEKTRSQMWPRAAWNDGAKCWLVAWREGNIGDLAADIWCARVTADGKASDAAGIKVCAAAENQERPWVASDGKGFLVVWEDFRNGKDYDVYAARVSADGKVLDPEGVLVAGGEHNQCHPVVACAGGNYYVAWQGYGGDGNRYLLYGSRVSADGKVLDGQGVVLTPGGGGGDAQASAYNPVISAVGDRVMIAYLVADGGPGKMKAQAAVVSVDAKSGKPQGQSQVLGHAEQRMPALACGEGGGLVAAPLGVSAYKNTGLCLYRIDANGKAAGTPQKIAGASAAFSPLYTLAFDGQKYLLTADRPSIKGRGMGPIRVYGWALPAEGQPLPGADLKDDAFDQNGFAIAGDGDNYQMQGFACAGPKGVCLVAYVEVRGADDLKVLARVVGP